jgi:nucleotidyltransferase substrate binding protein (TIGR01987 family)
LRQAFKQGWIAEEEGWLAMLEARNRLAHTYEASQALAIYEQLPEFSQRLRRLHGALSSEKG